MKTAITSDNLASVLEYGKAVASSPCGRNHGDSVSNLSPTCRASISTGRRSNLVPWGEMLDFLDSS